MKKKSELTSKNIFDEAGFLNVNKTNIKNIVNDQNN